ncbi:MAG: hypothetical protein F6K48_03000 [Okeania sp. SIO3H1]|nr:hypothetical protein [Okeania sp. SIO3H1]
MSRYDATTVLGDSRLHIRELYIKNPLVGVYNGIAYEDLVVRDEGGERIVSKGRVLRSFFDEAEGVEKLDLDGSPLGVISHVEIQIAGYSLARALQIGKDNDPELSATKYNPTVNKGDQRYRVGSIRFAFPLDLEENYVFAGMREQRIMRTADGEVEMEESRQFSESLEHESTINMLHPLNDTVIGQLTLRDVSVAFYSLARSMQIVADQEG